MDRCLCGSLWTERRSAGLLSPPPAPCTGAPPGSVERGCFSTCAGQVADSGLWHLLPAFASRTGHQGAVCGLTQPPPWGHLVAGLAHLSPPPLCKQNKERAEPPRALWRLPPPCPGDSRPFFRAGCPFSSSSTKCQRLGLC